MSNPEPSRPARSHAEWQKYFEKENGKMTTVLMREFNRTYESTRIRDCKEWQFHADDAKTAVQADEKQGLNAKPIKDETCEKIVKRARVKISERDLDPYTSRLVADMSGDTFGKDWSKLDLVRCRFLEDYYLIRDLLKVADALTAECNELKKRKRSDTDSE